MKCVLEITVHKFKCKDCKACRWVNLPFAVGKLPMTKAFVNYIISLIKISTVKSIAGLLNLQRKTVKNIHKDWLTEKYKKISYKKLTYISMDEFSIKKGHTYMTVFLDLKTGRIIYAVEGRRIEDIRPFLEKLRKRARNLKAIAMDMSTSYISAVKEYLPRVDIVFDRFHVVKILNTAVDEVRRQERRKYEVAGMQIGKGERFLFLRNFEDLNTDERGRLKLLFEINETLAKAHMLKEQFREFWGKTSRQEAAFLLVNWIFTAIKSNIKPIVQVAHTMLSHYEGLLSYFDHRISNGKIEGTNNKIKVLKRTAYGYRDLKYFTLLLLDLHQKSIMVA
jgi:Transposase and inactivated derivatives